MAQTKAVAKKKLVAVIGAGYWGKNLVRNFHALDVLATVCDANDETLNRIRQEYSVATTKDYDAVLRDPAVDAVVIAAPAAQHHEVAMRALHAGKHVFVEKPLALRVEEGKELVELARERNLVLMVGHILEYHPAIIELKRLIQQGHLGKIQYIHSSRLNLGKLRTEENILWSFAPHDISVILQMLGETPMRAAAHGGSYLNPPIVDTTVSTLEFPSGAKAHIFVSWLHPFKEQKLCVIGSERMAVFDDLEPEKKLVLYAHRVSWRDRKPVAERDGDQVVELPKDEPLLKECEHFLECVATGSRPRTDGDSGLRVLEVLDACGRSLNQGGVPVSVIADSPRYYAHPTAVIDQPCEIGEGTKIWHYSHILKGAKIGDRCKISSHTFICEGVTIESGVFIGHGVTFINDRYPRAVSVAGRLQTEADWHCQSTVVKQGATIGSGATLLGGITIGENAMVGAGSVVTKDVPPNATVAGNPARIFKEVVK